MRHSQFIPSPQTQKFDESVPCGAADINLSPAELAAQCVRVLERQTTALEVAELFTAPAAAESGAYSAYAERWQEELAELLRS